MKKTIYVLIVVLVGVGIFAAYFILSGKNLVNKKTKAAQDLVNLTIVSPDHTLTTISEFSLPITINANTNKVTAVELHIHFDPTKFDFVKIASGSFFPDPIVLSSAKVADGVITYVLADRPTATRKGKDGAGFLATVTMKPKNLNTSHTSVSFTSDTKVAALEKSESLLGQTTATQISVSSGQ